MCFRRTLGGKEALTAPFRRKAFVNIYYSLGGSEHSKSVLMPLLVMAFALFAVDAYAGTPSAPTASTCEHVQLEDFSQVQDAPTQILSTAFKKAEGENPAYCHLEGYVTPNVGFEIMLPDAWNGKFLQIGCGGWCGITGFTVLCPVKKGYACISTDMGHKSTTHDAKWAYNNLQGQFDFAVRATHVVTLAGKAIAERYYSKPPERSYFMGCSQGARQGMMEAQRFPWDFDGIVAGGIPIDQERNVMTHLWAGRALFGEDGQGRNGKSILSTVDLKLVHQAALDRCDADDGVKDGLIGDPSHCQFDPAVLLCKAGRKSACLDEEQVSAVKKIYEGPATSKGEPIYTGGPVVGSELNWVDAFFDGKSGRPIDGYADLYRYMAFMPAPGPTWKPTDFDFDNDYKRLALTEAIQAASNPDLRKFKAAGGKLLAYHGWSDEGVPPRHFIDYYRTVERTMGGSEKTLDFFRLFMIPGMNHCSGGDGAFAVDYLSYLEAWVEHGEAPNMMIGAHVNGYEDWVKAYFELKFPLDPKLPVTFTRPYYPYPFQARYKGSGDPNKAESFYAVSP